MTGRGRNSPSSASRYGGSDCAGCLSDIRCASRRFGRCRNFAVRIAGLTLTGVQCMAVVHEMRVYEAMPGRLGDLNKRFREITLPIWLRLGIRPLGFWTCLVGPSNNALIYILSWDSMAERDRLWSLFQTDEEWLRRKGEMDRDGPLVARAENQLIQLTDYSPQPG